MDGSFEERKEFKTDRVIDLFLRALKGESLSAQTLADEYHVSTRSITRDFNSLKVFLAEHRDVLGDAELEYSGSDHCYTLRMGQMLTNKELLAITKVLIGCRAFNSDDLLLIIKKLKANTTPGGRDRLASLVKNELFHYVETGSDCRSVIDHIWKLTECITSKREITIVYYKMNRNQVKHRIRPVSIMFTEYYFYLIAYKCEGDAPNTPYYFRVDRITDITTHREHYQLTKEQNVDEGELRKKSQFMFPGRSMHIRFAFTGPSVQAVLDRIPTAKVVDRTDSASIIEADVYGDGIRMFLFSQGSWVKVLSPESFKNEMKEEIEKMLTLY